MYSNFEELADLGKNADKTLRVSVRGAGPFWAREVIKFFAQGYEAVSEQQFHTPSNDAEAPEVRDYWAVTMGLSEMAVPFSIEYRDVGGTEYVTQQHFVFEIMIDRLAVRLVASARKALAPPLPSPFITPGTRDERRTRT
jgi:hypothetical protein